MASLFFNRNPSLISFYRELPFYLINQFIEKNVSTLPDLLKKGDEGCKRMGNFGIVRSEKVRDFVKIFAPEEYDFYTRPVVFTHKEINAIQNKEYEKIRIDHLGLSGKFEYHTKEENLYTLKDLLNLGINGIKYERQAHRRTIEMINKELTNLAEKLPEEDKNYFMRDQ